MRVLKFALQQTRWFTLSIIAFIHAHLISSCKKTKEFRNSVKMSEVLKLYLPSNLRPKIFVKLHPTQLTKRYLNIRLKTTPKKKAKLPQTYAYLEPCQKSKTEFFSENS